jgi:hypothetical protein
MPSPLADAADAKSARKKFVNKLTYSLLDYRHHALANLQKCVEVLLAVCSNVVKEPGDARFRKVSRGQARLPQSEAWHCFLRWRRQGARPRDSALRASTSFLLVMRQVTYRRALCAVYETAALSVRAAQVRASNKRIAAAFSAHPAAPELLHIAGWRTKVEELERYWTFDAPAGSQGMECAPALAQHFHHSASASVIALAGDQLQQPLPRVAR